MRTRSAPTPASRPSPTPSSSSAAIGPTPPPPEQGFHGPPRIPQRPRHRRGRGAADLLARGAGRGGRREALRRAALRQREPAAHDGLPRAAHADLLPRAEREPRHRGRGRQGAASRGRAPAEGLWRAGGKRAGARLHLPRLRAGREDLREGRRVRPPRHAGEEPQGLAPRRAAPRWRRYLAGQRHGALVQGPGHGRRLPGARRGRHDRALGVHPRRRSREADRRQGLQGQGRFHRAERGHGRLRRPGLPALRDQADQRRPRRDRGTGVPLHPDREPALPRARTGPSASRSRSCRRRWTRPGARARRW